MNADKDKKDGGAKEEATVKAQVMECLWSSAPEIVGQNATMSPKTENWKPKTTWRAVWAVNETASPGIVDLSAIWLYLRVVEGIF